MLDCIGKDALLHIIKGRQELRDLLDKTQEALVLDEQSPVVLLFWHD